MGGVELCPGGGSCSWDSQLHLHQEDSVMVGEDLVYSLILTPFINSVSCLLCQPPFWGCQSRPKLVPQEAEAAKADGNWCHKRPPTRVLLAGTSKKGIPFVKSIATFTLWCNLSSWWFDKRRLFRKKMSIEHSWSLWQLKIEVWFVCNRDKKSFPQGVSCPFVVKNVDPGRTWTCNLRCRKPTPYPLGHRALAILHKICVSVMTQDFNTRPHSGKTYVVYLWLQEIHSNTTPSHDYLAQNLYFWFTCCMCWL